MSSPESAGTDVSDASCWSLDESRHALASSSTASRRQHLRNLHEKLAQHTVANAIELLPLLVLTIPYYTDRPSRHAVQTCLRDLLSAPVASKHAVAAAATISEQSEKLGISAAHAFVLVEWCSILMEELAGSVEWELVSHDVYVALVNALDRVNSGNVRSTMAKSALVVTRRGLRKLLKLSKHPEELLRDMVTLMCAHGSSGPRNSLLLGLVAGVAARNLKAKPIIESLKAEYVKFYIREFLGSKSTVPPYLANAMHDFFADFITVSDLQQDICLPLEKSLLRSPEVVLCDLVTPLVDAIPPNLDLSPMLEGNVLKHILSNAKSSNANIRDGALRAFNKLMLRCSDKHVQSRCLHEVLSPLVENKLSSPDHKVIYARMLSCQSLIETHYSHIATAMSRITAKEGNEAVLAAEVATLALCTKQFIRHGSELDKAVLDAFTNGVAAKKASIRHVWFTHSGDVILSCAKAGWNSPIDKFCATLLPAFVPTWTEILKAPLMAPQNGLVASGYVICAIVLLLSEKDAFQGNLEVFNIKQQWQVTDSKTAFLINPKVFSKLAISDEYRWLLNTLIFSTTSLSLAVTYKPEVVWAAAWITLLAGVNVDPDMRQAARNALQAEFIKSPSFVFHGILAGLRDWLRTYETGEKDAASHLVKHERGQLYQVLNCLCPHQQQGQDSSSGEALEQHLCALVVLARPDLIPRASWIELCMRSGLDPGQLATKYHDQLLETVLQSSGTDEIPAFRRAAYNAAAELAFVCPDIITPRLVEMIQQDLDPKQLDGIGPLEAAIFRAPEGTLVVDVLTNKSRVPDKSSKDFEILQWEEELRADIAKRKGQQRKPTPEEAAQIKSQLKKESDIRTLVATIEARVMRGIGIVECLARGPPTEAVLWMSHAVDSILGAIDAGVCNITGDSAPQAFLALSERVSPRILAIRQFIGVSIIRSRNISNLPRHLCEEPLEEQVTRILFKLRFSAEQRSFDAATFIYTLPLIMRVLDSGGFSDNQDDNEAQVVLAIEYLSLHTDVCSEEAVPRARILSALISSIRRYRQHYKIIKDCFSDMVRCIAVNLRADEIAVLTKGTIVPEVSVRTVVLQSISADVDLSDVSAPLEIWLACHEDDEENRGIAADIWEEGGFSHEDIDDFHRLLPYIHDQDLPLRRASTRALASLVMHKQEAVPDYASRVVAMLKESYVELAKPKQQELDKFGMPRKTDSTDSWDARHGVALALKEMAPHLPQSLIDPLFDFFVKSGPLSDASESVRAQMLEAATRVIEIHGKCLVEKLMPSFEEILASSSKSSKQDDLVNEAVVIMYGALARHLTKGDDKLPVVIERLITTLSTPSETVQLAIAECLPSLICASGDASSKYFDMITQTLLAKSGYAAQRGAAYGLAAIVKGRGLASLRKYRIMVTLQAAAGNKKEQHQREAALLAYELFSTIIGQPFEPFVLQIVPQLLAGFGDSNSNVRDSALAAAKACFAKLTSFGVRKMLPILLEGLNDSQWRSKKGACDLLGATAYLDPQQLAQSLPEIIPPLTAVLSDSHKEVRATANRSLKRFGEIITNPEIKGLIDVLLKALSDPSKYTDDALAALIKVHFVHYLDAPSLALVAKILQRGLGDRSSTKQKAAQVIGSLAHLTERKDLVAHLPVLVTGLKVAVVDPVPTTRATASRALGSLIEKLGEDAMPDLIPGLMHTLKSESGAGDRLGSAQALSEVLAGLGTSRLEDTLPTILQNAESSRPSVREGFMSLFIFLPVCFGNSFSAYLGRIIPAILAGLADDVDSIRETSLRAGRLLVKNFATRAVDLLLPELERGLSDDNYRIRLSSVELVGDMLFNLTGISGQVDTEEPDEHGEIAKEAGASLKELLGEDKRNRVLSALYICRCDTAAAVRSAAVGVWKVLVPSPRILKELVPTLSQFIIRRLGSDNMEHRLIASNSLGELIRRAGDGVLASLLPTLEETLKTSPDSDAKQGICLALRELISSASAEALEEHQKTLVAVVRAALTDADENVREAAAEAFDALQQILGKRAVDQVLPHLLNLLRSPEDADHALAALLTLLTDNTRSNAIIPTLIPTLITPPITAFNAKALASLCRVAGAAMNRRLPGIITSLLDTILECRDESRLEDLDKSFDTVILSIDEWDGLNTVMNVMLQLVKHEDHRKRETMARHMASFFSQATVDYTRYNQEIVQSLLRLFDDRDDNVVKAAWTALSEFTKKLKKEDMEALVSPTRVILGRVGVHGVPLRGFELPKGINAILPIFLQGLMNGTPEQRTQAALGMSDIIDRTSEAALKPFVTQITGPLIRVVSERSVDVRAAILLTLNNLLEKTHVALRPFLPQLQRTFAKSLADPSSEILRTRAAKALGTLIKFTTRVDPLIGELVTGSKTSNAGVRTAMLKALYEIVSQAGANMSEASRTAVLNLIDGDNDKDDNNSPMTITYAKLLGALIKNVPAEVAETLLKNRVVTTNFSNASVLSLNAVLVESPVALLHNHVADAIPNVLCQGMQSKNTYWQENFILATGKYLLVDEGQRPFEVVKQLFEVLSTIIPQGHPTDSRRLSLVIFRTLSRKKHEIVRPHFGLLAPPIFSSVRDTIIPVKLAAEAAFVSLFEVADEDSKVFDKFMAGNAAQALPPTTAKSMQDYFKRVGLRLGAQVRERREAEGGVGGLGLSNDEIDDEKEIWSVGQVEVGSEIFD